MLARRAYGYGLFIKKTAFVTTHRSGYPLAYHRCAKFPFATILNLERYEQ